MTGRQEFDAYVHGPAALRAEARRDWLIWLITSLIAGAALPFGLVALIYRVAFEGPGHSHAFPSLPMLFGRGDLLLVILSVSAATVAEFWLNPGHLKSLYRGAALLVSLLIAAVACSLFTTITYIALTGKQANIDNSMVTFASALMLSLVVSIQTVTQLTRPKHP